jgi:HEPN domain-containing protein
MTDEEKFGFWLGHAQYALETAEAMFKSDKWVCVVFMCEQAIEKLVKGLYFLYVDDNIPRLHDINAVFSKFSERLPRQIREEYLDLFRQLSDCRKNTRYTEYIQNASEMINEPTAKSIFNKTKEAYQWLLTQKS